TTFSHYLTTITPHTAVGGAPGSSPLTVHWSLPSDTHLPVVKQVDHGSATAFSAFVISNSSRSTATQIRREGHAITLAPTTSTNFRTVAKATWATENLRPYDPDPSSFTTLFTSNTEGELIQAVKPGGNVQRWIYDANGNLLQEIKRASTTSGAAAL